MAACCSPTLRLRNAGEVLKTHQHQSETCSLKQTGKRMEESNILIFKYHVYVKLKHFPLGKHCSQVRVTKDKFVEIQQASSHFPKVLSHTIY